MRNLSKPSRHIILGIPFIVILGSLFHFTFEILGRNPVVGAISAVNESSWEHMKLVVFPLLIWWGIYYLMAKTNYGIDGNKWFFAMLIALVTSTLLIPMLYYGFKGAFGFSNLIIDILIFVAAVGVGNILALHIYIRHKGISMFISIGIIALIALSFIVFTFSTPKLPIFLDPINGTYGI